MDMSTDKHDQAGPPAASAEPQNGNKDVETTARAKHHETVPGAYEPEAHHEWFPSERFFLSWVAVCITGYLTLCLTLIAHHLAHPGYQAGDVADRNIIATHAAMVVDEPATLAKREEVREAVTPVFKTAFGGETGAASDIHAKVQQISELQEAGLAPIRELTIAEHIALLRANDVDFFQFSHGSNPPISDELQKIKARLATVPNSAKLINSVEHERQALKTYTQTHKDAGDAIAALAVSISPSDLASFGNRLETSAKRMCRVFMRLPVEDTSAWHDTAIEFLPDNWNPLVRRYATALICSVLQPNVCIDRAATGVRAEQAVTQVKPVMKHISAGQVIVQRNAAITPESIQIIQAMGITDSNHWSVIAVLCISLAAACALVGLYFYNYEAKLLFSTRSIALMYTVAIITVALGSFCGKSLPQVVPLQAAALLLTIFFGQRAAIALILPLAVFVTVDHLIDFNNLVALGTAAGAAIGTYSRRRNALMHTGMVIGVAQAFGYLAALAVNQTGDVSSNLGAQLGLEFIGGIGSSVIAIGILPFVENIFGLVTPFRLAELTDADQPLLRKLEENAPGTYQHSLAVANLAEAGARAIDADVILVRAGSYYHDVGKMVRPKFFIENQLGATNPHDSMSPEDSRARVLAHVTDGLDLAKRYSLPKAVQDFIPMHQGTSLMAYFYHKACLRDGVENVEQSFYRYPGPKPQSKETSIVMLADVSEAVTHSMKNPTEEEVELAIGKVFQNRWDDGQFNESGLTYSELLRIQKAFVRVWRTLHHDRLKYPSTTTGRMAVPPKDLPSAADIASTVTGNEFVDEPATGTKPGDATKFGGATASGTDTMHGSETKLGADTAISAEPEIQPSCCERFDDELPPESNGQSHGRK